METRDMILLGAAAWYFLFRDDGGTETVAVGGAAKSADPGQGAIGSSGGTDDPDALYGQNVAAAFAPSGPGTNAVKGAGPKVGSALLSNWAQLKGSDTAPAGSRTSISFRDFGATRKTLTPDELAMAEGARNQAVNAFASSAANLAAVQAQANSAETARQYSYSTGGSSRRGAA